MSPDFKAQLSILLESVLTKIPEASSVSSLINLEIPPDKKYGEYSSNVALRLARVLKKDPLDLAMTIRDTILAQLPRSQLNKKVETIEVVKPGFINFHLTRLAVAQGLEQILKEGEKYGRSTVGKGQKVQIEFVSANPTGPLSVAHGRQAAVGDALSNILIFLGYHVDKEYYVNDCGHQIDLLGRSLELRARELLGETIQFPEDGYQGDYIRDVAKVFLERRHIQTTAQLNQKDLAAFRRFGVEYLTDVIKNELSEFGVHYDGWSHQSKLATPKTIESVLNVLREKGVLYEHEGALWFKSSGLGDDKDRVLKKN